MIWYVVTHEDSGYPIVIYPEKQRAGDLAELNGGKVVPVETPPGTKIVDQNGKEVKYE